MAKEKDPKDPKEPKDKKCEKLSECTAKDTEIERLKAEIAFLKILIVDAYPAFDKALEDVPPGVCWYEYRRKWLRRAADVAASKI